MLQYSVSNSVSKQCFNTVFQYSVSKQCFNTVFQYNVSKNVSNSVLNSVSIQCFKQCLKPCFNPHTMFQNSVSIQCFKHCFQTRPGRPLLVPWRRGRWRADNLRAAVSDVPVRWEVVYRRALAASCVVDSCRIRVVGDAKVGCFARGRRRLRHQA